MPKLASATPRILSSAITVERDRRIEAGFWFGGKLFQARPEDQLRLSGAANAASVAIANGAQPGDLNWHGEPDPFAWIAEDNTQMVMDAQTTIAFGMALLRHVNSHIFAARALKNADPIPEDFSSDEHWTVTTAT